MADIPTSIPFLEAAYRPRPVMEDTGGQSFMRSFQAAQQVGMQQKELALRTAMMPLQIEVMRMQQIANILGLIEAKRKADTALQIKGGNALLAEKMAKIDWSSPSDRASIWEIGKKFPELLETQEWNRIQQNFINSDKAAAQAEHWKNLYELGQSRIEMESERNTNLSAIAEARLKLQEARTDDQRLHWQQMVDLAEAKNKLLETRIGAGTATQQDMAAAQKLRQEAETLRAAGDAQGYQDKIRQAELLETHIAPKGITVTTGTDDQGRPITTTTVGGGAPTTSTQSIAQQKTIQNENAIEGITAVLSKVTPADVGVRGVLGEQVVDKWLTQIDPALASKPRIENRTALRALRESLFAAMSGERASGTGFSNKDAERIKELASGLEASTSYPDLVARMSEIRSIIKQRTKVFAERTGQPVPEFAKEPEELKDEYEKRRLQIIKDVQENRLTREQGQAELQRIYDQLSSSLFRFHNLTVQPSR